MSSAAAKTVDAAADRLSERHFRAIAKLIEDRVGIQLPPNKRTMVEGRLRRRLRALDLPSLDAYGRRLFDEGGLEAEFVDLIDCVTTNKTDFFREPEHFALLRELLVPQLLEGRAGADRHLKVWSAACSTGAEPYTLAMVLDDLAQSHGFAFSVLGTDISASVLDQAVRAVYPADMVAPVPPDFRRRYVMRARKPGRGEVRIVPELRRLVRFQRLNLMDQSFSVDRDVDVIFCRNVLIYFAKPVQEAVLQRLCAHLRPGGFLLLGHSESLSGNSLPGMRQVAPTVLCRC